MTFRSARGDTLPPHKQGYQVPGTPPPSSYSQGLLIWELFWSQVCRGTYPVIRVATGESGTPTKRQVSKRQVSKRPVSKRLKRQVYKMSGLRNVRFTKCQVYKTSGLRNVRLQKNP